MRSVPKSLRAWFVIHFFADMLFALPLMFFPTRTLGLFGWLIIDPIAARLVGAALFGIGMISLIARNASKEMFSHMLLLKMLWSGAAILSFVISLYQGAPKSVWLFLVIFAFFFALWTSYRMRLER